MTTIDCASWTPIASFDSERVLRALEWHLNRVLPSTFRELIALENGPALMGHFSNSDVPIPPHQLAQPLAAKMHDVTRFHTCVERASGSSDRLIGMM